MFKHKYTLVDVVFGVLVTSFLVVIVIPGLGLGTGIWSMVKVFGIAFALFWIIDRITV